MNDHLEDSQARTDVRTTKNYTKVSPCDHGDPIYPCELEMMNATRPRASRLLFMSHLMAQFSEVSFQFSMAIFLAAFNYGDSPMRLVSTYGLTMSAAVTLSNGWLGNYIDSTERWATASSLILLENGAVICTTVAAYFLLHLMTLELDSSTAMMSAIVLIHLFGAMAQSLDQALLVALERDWIVIMASDDEEWLSSTTVTLRQIDLSCKIAAPALMGGIMTIVPLKNSCIIVGALNGTALVTEYVCTQRIYQIVPELAAAATDQTKTETFEVSGKDFNPTKEASGMTLFVHLRAYLRQPSFPAGLGLALLYGNALTFGNGILTAFLLSQGGISLRTIGVVRGIAAGIGLLGTFAFRISDSFMPLESTGMWSILSQTLCLLIPFLSFWSLPNQSFVILLLVGVCASRIGLWVFDIVVTRIQQNEVPECSRGVVGGMQQSLNAGFTILSFAVGVVTPNSFGVFLAIATTSALMASALFAFGIFFPRRKGQRIDTDSNEMGVEV